MMYNMLCMLDRADVNPKIHFLVLSLLASLPGYSINRDEEVFKTELLLAQTHSTHGHNSHKSIQNDSAKPAQVKRLLGLLMS